jgi:hypothetical protein
MSLVIHKFTVLVIFGLTLISGDVYTNVSNDIVMIKRWKVTFALARILEVLNKISYFSLSRSNYTSIS